MQTETLIVGVGWITMNLDIESEGKWKISVDLAF